MSAEVTTPDMSAALEGARSALAAKMSPSPAASPAVAPSTPVAAPSEATPAAAPSIPASPATLLRPATGSEPASPAAPPVPVTQASPAPINLETLSPAARRFLEMNGGDIDKALARAIDFNNRLGATHKAHPEWFEPGGPADPKAPPLSPDQSVLFGEPSPTAASPTATPTATGIAGQQPQATAPELAPAEVQVDWTQVATDTDQFVLKDPTCTSLVRQWATNTQEIQSRDKQISDLNTKRVYLETQIADATLGLTDLDKADRQDQIRQLRYDSVLLETEKRNLILQNDDLGLRFNKIKETVQDQIARNYYETAQQQAQAEELKAFEDRAYNELKMAWDPAVPRVAAALGIPADLVSDFESEATRTVQAQYVTNPNFLLNDVEGFLTQVGKAYLGRMDRYHRAQAGLYAQQALTRAAAPSPTLPAGTPVAAPKPDAQLTPEEAMARVAKELSHRLRG